MLVWPMVAVLGFLALTVLVVALGTTSTAQYEFGRNRVLDGRLPAPAEAGCRDGAAPAGRVDASGPASGRSGGAPAEDSAAQRTAAVGVAAHPAGKRRDTGDSAGWWLIEDDDRSGFDDATVQVVAGPFPDRMEADWAALTMSAPPRVVYGARAATTLVPRPSPQEQAWLTQLGEQLDGLASDWDVLLSDDDLLGTLLVEVTAALVDAGLGLHDCAGLGSADALPGGVCLTPAPQWDGLLVSWHQHERMSLEQVRGAPTVAAVQGVMNAAVARVLAQSGFEVTPLAGTGCSLVTAGEG